jgi:hypothetical protein
MTSKTKSIHGIYSTSIERIRRTGLRSEPQWDRAGLSNQKGLPGWQAFFSGGVVKGMRPPVAGVNAIINANEFRWFSLSAINGIGLQNTQVHDPGLACFGSASARK